MRTLRLLRFLSVMQTEHRKRLNFICSYYTSMRKKIMAFQAFFITLRN